MAGKGDKPRPADGNKYRDGWVRIFKEKKQPTKKNKKEKGHE